MAKQTGVVPSSLQAVETAQFVSIVLFSGIGLLISLIVVICRINGLF